MEHGFPCGSAGKESTHNEGDLGSIPGLGRSPGEGKGYPLQYSGLENSLDCTVHGVTKSPTGLSDFHFHFTVEQRQPWLLVALLLLKLLALGELRSSCSGEGSGYPLQYSCRGNPMDRGGWRATIHGSLRVEHDWVTNTFTLSLPVSMEITKTLAKKYPPTLASMPEEQVTVDTKG